MPVIGRLTKYPCQDQVNVVQVFEYEGNKCRFFLVQTFTCKTGDVTRLGSQKKKKKLSASLKRKNASKHD